MTHATSAEWHGDGDSLLREVCLPASGCTLMCLSLGDRHWLSVRELHDKILHRVQRGRSVASWRTTVRATTQRLFDNLVLRPRTCFGPKMHASLQDAGLIDHRTTRMLLIASQHAADLLREFGQHTEADDVTDALDAAALDDLDADSDRSFEPALDPDGSTGLDVAPCLNPSTQPKDSDWASRSQRPDAEPTAIRFRSEDHQTVIDHGGSGGRFVFPRYGYQGPVESFSFHLVDSMDKIGQYFSDHPRKPACLVRAFRLAQAKKSPKTPPAKRGRPKIPRQTS